MLFKAQMSHTQKVLLKVKIACLHSEKILLMSDCLVAVDRCYYTEKLKSSFQIKLTYTCSLIMTQYCHFHKCNKMHKYVYTLTQYENLRIFPPIKFSVKLTSMSEKATDCNFDNFW